MTDENTQGPLSGIRILDLTRIIMGPLSTQVLADQGADVIMVEAARGDNNRIMGPGPDPEFSGISLNMLRNKRSIAVDLKSAEGMDVVRRLIATCDVVVSTMRPNALVRLGLDYDSVAAIKPDVVYCQAQGFPLDSPRANEPAYDDIIQVASGISDMMQRVWGHSALLPTIIADKVCGLVIAQAVAAALVHRARTGEGQHVEVAMQEATTAFMLAEHVGAAATEPPSPSEGVDPTGYPRILSRERRPHDTKDGQVHLFPYQPKHYAAIFRVAGVPDAESDPRYVNRREAIRNSDSLYRDIRAIAPLRTTEEWLTYCRETGIPATPVMTLRELVDALPLAEHPAIGPYRVIPAMARFSRTPVSLRRNAPRIGENGAEVLAELDAIEREQNGTHERESHTL